MSGNQILLLGAVAGSTIFLGLPLGRLASPSLRLKGALSATATGILIFLLYDILKHGFEPVDVAVQRAADGGSWSHLVWYATLFAGGGIAGLMSLVFYDRWMKRQRERALLGPGSASVAEFETNWVVGLSPARWLALLIATGIGLHNFSEGLAIGQAGARSEISLALILIIGFGLHNATEGFGIVAPLSGDTERPSWRFLGMLGLIGGGPTFIGTVIGQRWVSEPLSIAFLALAAGSILYVVMELMGVNRTLAGKTIVASGVMLGLLLGFATELVLVAAGA